MLIETHKNHIEDIYDIKNKLTSVRKNLFPLKIAINDLMTDESELVNKDSYGEGWMIKIKVADGEELSDLMDADAYKAMIDA